MNTLSGTFRFVVIGVIVMAAVVSCCYFPFIKGTAAYATLEIGDQSRANRKYKGPYVEWKDRGQFEKALQQVCDHQGEYDLFVVLQGTDEQHPEHWKKRCTPNPSGNIRTVKVTKSKAVDKIAAGESVANDPNVMHRVQSPDPGDVDKVLEALK